jgi:hypothetical protein
VNRLAIRRIAIVATLVVAVTSVCALALRGDAVLSILVRDSGHPCAPYQSTGDSFYVQIFHCHGLPLVWQGVNYGVFPGVLMTIPGPAGGRVQIDVDVPSGCYLVRALAACKNVVSDWAYVEACCGQTVCANLIIPTVKHCILRMAASLQAATIDPEGGEDLVIDVWPDEVFQATSSLLQIAELLPEDSLEFPQAPDVDDIDTLGDGECCASSGGVLIDLTALPYTTFSVPNAFVYQNVPFTEIYEDIRLETGLFCYGSELVGTTWYDATVSLDLTPLSCYSCTVRAEVNGHGPEARMKAFFADGSTTTEVCPGDRRVLTIVGTYNYPIVRLELSGQEAEWYWIEIN